MAPLAVVEELDVFEDCTTRLGSRAPLSLVHQFDFESGEEAFRHRIVPTVSAPAHAADDSVLGEQSLIFPARVLGRFKRSSQYLDRGNWDDY